ncbi:MAG: bifunctional (p)ppGpp synthetase/guanosine-3',5'-bis(diphosphate) 3'-pyrophosphohydrolase [Rubrobacteraceae bacterium]|uniref:RelA/SpoT family protein n=1 Tax=Rubrobacter naiadicus TaxID=1392641 RepID=UPI0023614D98|nr:bifunctional (p)ppGpp synthetase/guanosine-3',5'-bis(diphosphate) 3'-pyrophosphohydrolase [Rubrobacter naiadicus]MBX6762248.1 bifunctional (p)ppGpp synthetase/guanosine-3',5'-bis(diphosphate) 3'-pyrophosphohydrolase [Rubrobacteraceae bacterium]MCL6437740.1 bifunctional (p)ppGpp synthetase/guanosine-3',5'-bis(diphosphate) 3'-pyrophosphohydrolase [Rubrobacteraceae bacterium]
MELARTTEQPGRNQGEGLTISSLIEKVSSYSPEGREEEIAEAYRLAHAAHRGQTRKSGEPFVEHPLAVADILADLRMDTTTIIGGLLHDVIEDTDVTKEELGELFGSEVAEIVDGVTKLKRLPSGNLEEAQAESLRKMVVAMSRDVRVIIIKLADRLHNMRTLEYLHRDTQIKKATETLEIYAPLAHRLGIHSIKWELEDLSFATLHPRRYEEIKRLVAARRADREAFIARVAEELKGHLGEAGIEAEVRGRVKHFYSIYDKMVRRNKEFNEIYDLAGLRVVVDSVRDCYAALGVVHSVWKPIPGRFKDYIAMPKFNMYQSLHTTVMSNEGKLLEIQIRTHDMDVTAEYGIAAHWMYKERDGGSRADRLNWLKNMIEWQKETTDSTEFMNFLKDELVADEVFVFTPKGDVISLPAGATPIDFAYHVHTEVGHRCVGAKVNGRIVPLDSELVSGDRVEILTGKSASPSRDWLSVVHSGRARNKIRQYFNKADREENLTSGREKVQELLKKRHVERVPQEVWEEVAEKVNHPSPEEMLTAVGAGSLSAENVANRIAERVLATQEEEEAGEKEERTSPALAPLPLPSDGEETGVRVVGSSGVLTRLARCCTPLPGDEIVGYVSLGRGVVVHASGCPNARSLRARSPERFVEVEWAAGPDKLFTVEILVEALDRTHLLSDITRTISDAGLSIISARVDTIEERTALSRFAFRASSTQHVKDVIRKIRAIPDVYDVCRVSRDGTPIEH